MLSVTSKDDTASKVFRRSTGIQLSGFVSIEHRVKVDETTFNLQMEMDAIATEEVVVVGYGKQKKRGERE